MSDNQQQPVSNGPQPKVIFNTRLWETSHKAREPSNDQSNSSHVSDSSVCGNCPPNCSSCSQTQVDCMETDEVVNSPGSPSSPVSKSPSVCNSLSVMSRRRIRSRSMPNLGEGSKVQKPPSLLVTFNAKRLRRKKSLRLSGLQTKQSPISASCSSSPACPSTTLLASSSPSMISPSISTSMATMPQPPPVNSQSLKEIDLQEIFKNPQLRHDVVFDPQLQFRPNLDGERGKRKRLLAEKYWESVVVEAKYFIQDNPVWHGKSTNGPTKTLNASSKLPLLFSTLRDILVTLLPAKDRSLVDSVLDTDLIIQQIEHGTLDFINLAAWLASVFKAHCAPMRDSWVDQMVDRIQLGVQSNSARRLVEGLRMIFAILEAMKLDVANHQIRTLRPMLIDTAIEFEQDYYAQVLDKGKIELSDALLWFASSVSGFDSSLEIINGDKYKSSFVYGLLKLLSCTQDMTNEFPSTFALDYQRLGGLRAELRKVVCLHLCISIYQQLLGSEAAKRAKAGQVPAAQLKSAVTVALSASSVSKLKQDLLAIIDSNGNPKWTKNTYLLALELSKRVQQVIYLRPVSVPDESLISVASGWLAKHLQPNSDVYKLVEHKTMKSLYQFVAQGLPVISALDAAVINGVVTTDNDNLVQKETVSLADRVLVLVRFHWGVFGKFYLASSGNHHDNKTDTSFIVQPSTTTVLEDMEVEPSLLSQDRLRQPSTC
jgi:hypothetical protein